MLVLAVAYFIGIHIFISGTRLRGLIAARTGERGFLVLFSLLSLIGLGWMIWAYARADLVVVWTPGLVARALALPLTLAAFVLVVAGLTTPSPTVVGGEAMLEEGQAASASGAMRITRHPFLWGVVLWALGHMLANGDAASMILFGGLLFLAAIGPGLIDGKRRRRLGPAWERFESQTSSVPFAAIVQGRNHLDLAEIGWWRMSAGAGLWVAMLAAHPWLFGASPLP